MSDESTKNYELMFAVYGDVDGAAGAVESLRDMDKDGTIDIVDAATLVKDADGKTSVKQESLPSVKKGTGIGALIGGAIGLLFPPSILGAAAIGAGIGAGTAKLAKMALEDDDLKDAADSLEPGTSAFIAVVENTWVEKVDQAIAGYSKLAEHTMDAEAAGVIGELTDDSSGTTVEYGAGRGPRAPERSLPEPTPTPSPEPRSRQRPTTRATSSSGRWPERRPPLKTPPRRIRAPTPVIPTARTPRAAPRSPSAGTVPRSRPGHPRVRIRVRQRTPG